MPGVSERFVMPELVGFRPHVKSCSAAMWSAELEGFGLRADVGLHA